jgi:Skp family chaperone for outer membrane proteins
MKVVVIAASLALALSAAPAFAQAAAGQARPRPAAPATPAPAPAQAAPAPPPAPPAPFPTGAKIAFVNLQQIANQSAEGKALTAKVQALMQKKQVEAQTKQKALADAQQKLQSSGTLLSDTARDALAKDIERMNVEGQRFQQDAQAEINELSQQLQNEFQQKLFPILDQLVKEHDLHLLLSAADAGIVAGNPGIDLTMEAVKKLDDKTVAGGTKPTSGAAPAPATAK